VYPYKVSGRKTRGSNPILFGRTRGVQDLIVAWRLPVQVHSVRQPTRGSFMLKRGVDLYQAVFNKLAECPRGRLLDVGSGNGDLARKLASLGHQAAPCDCLPESEWIHGEAVAYTRCDLGDGLPHADESFEYIICLEVIEPIENPMALCREIGRVLRKGGHLFMSTPNILNMRRRFKFLLDGSFLFFNFPPIEWERRDGRPNVHVHPIRFHELEYDLYKAGLEIDAAFINLCSYSWRLFPPWNG
jgi:SAM-dependent methyltransferase